MQRRTNVTHDELKLARLTLAAETGGTPEEVVARAAIYLTFFS